MILLKVAMEELSTSETRVCLKPYLMLSKAKEQKAFIEESSRR